jgi:hypothetical protein
MEDVMHVQWKQFLLVLTVGLLASGCGRSPTATGGSAQSDEAAAGTAYRLQTEPAGAKDVRAARSSVKDGDEVVVVGRVGGEKTPWVEGLAAFMIVDNSLKPCVDGCAEPWDYCCDTDLLPASKAMVKIVDDQGQIVQSDSRKLLGIKELQTVVARGKVQKDEAGNLTVMASGIFVRP